MVLSSKKVFNVHKYPELSIILIMAIINLKTKVSLKNISSSKEIETLLKILNQLGAIISTNHRIITIDTTNISNIELPLKLLTKRNITIYLLPILTNLFNYSGIFLDKDKSIYPFIHITNLMEYFGMSSNYDSKKIISQKIRKVGDIIVDVKNIDNIRYAKEVTTVAIILGCLYTNVIIANPILNKDNKLLIKYLNSIEMNIKVSKNQILMNSGC